MLRLVTHESGDEADYSEFIGSVSGCLNGTAENTILRGLCFVNLDPAAGVESRSRKLFAEFIVRRAWVLIGSAPYTPLNL